MSQKLGLILYPQLPILDQICRSSTSCWTATCCKSRPAPGMIFFSALNTRMSTSARPKRHMQDWLKEPDVVQGWAWQTLRERPSLHIQ